MSDAFSGFTFKVNQTPERRIYDNYGPWEGGAVDPKIIEVNLELLSVALRGDLGWASKHGDRNNETFKQYRYDRMRRAIENNEIIPTPCLYFREGRTRVMDGRHRLYVMIDLCFTHVNITVANEHLYALSTLI